MMMMAPNLNLTERTVPSDITICLSSEDDTATLSTHNTDSTDKTHNTNSQCSSMSDTESYECFGEGEMDSSLPPSHQEQSRGTTSTPNSLDLKRNTWIRTSLRRSPAKHNETLPNRKWGSFRQPCGKRLGSNALASQLYRSSSFNSSGRSSACDTTDDVYSDVSLEEDVLDLNHKISNNDKLIKNVMEDELEFDMWNGQFEFLGDSYQCKSRTKNNTIINGTYDKSIDLNFEPLYEDKWNLPLENAFISDISSRKSAAMTIGKLDSIDNINEDVQMLQQQMSVLADNQNHSDERYTRAKQENATLQARILMLEEQLREVELRSEEKLVEEEKRHRELVARVDREKQLQVENCAIRLQTLEIANNSLKEEATRYRNEYEIQRKENERLEERLEESHHLLVSLKEEIQQLRDQEKRHKEQQTATEIILEDLSKVIEILKTEKLSALAELQDCKETPSQIETELHVQLDSVRQEYKNLQESYEELQALLLTRGIQEGRSLLTGSNNLAAELEEMTNDDHKTNDTEPTELKIKTALKEQQEVNSQLRTYIDTILLNIVENYPQLLEVKGSNT